MALSLLSDAALSKTNVYTLIATALLGVLLFVINRFTERLPTTVIEVPDTASLQTERAAVPGYAEAGVADDGVPRVNVPADLIKLLDDIGVGGDRVVADALAWRQERGFLGPVTELGLTASDAPRARYESLDDAQLELLSAQGEVGATQTIARRNVTSDPFYSMELYEQAAEQGSTFALLRIASLRDAFGNVQLDAYQSDPNYLKRLSELRQAEGEALATEAFAYAFAAVRDGGLPIVDDDLLSWLRRLMSNVPLNMDEAACLHSEQIFLKLSAARRRRGLPPVSATPPAVFFSIPYVADQLPCTDTLHAWKSTQNLSQCEVLAVEDARDNMVDLYICTKSR